MPSLVPVEFDPFQSGDPEAAGSAGASRAMEPAVRNHFAAAFSPTAPADYYDPNRSLAQNALDPRGIEQAMNVGLSVGPGAIRAYHGSPHDFDAFDMSKIGTGEGAQAYGHGLYFAENPATARVYRENLSQGGYLSNDGVVNYGDVHTGMADAAKAAAGLHPDQARQIANYVLDGIDVYGSPAKFLKEFEFPSGKFGDAYQAAAQVAVNHSLRPNPGKMYEVNLNAEPDQFLHWDKPLSEQPQAVQDAFGQRVEQIQQSGQPTISSVMTDIRRGTLPGGSVYQTMGRGTPESAATALRDAGIPGIRYLDQGSRGTGDGTHNYVVFDPKLIEIVRKYGVAGLIAGGSLPAGQYMVPVDHDPFN